MLAIFESDETVAVQQATARAHQQDADDAREIRAHRRLRSLAWWIFLAPVVAQAIGYGVSLLMAGMPRS